MQQVAAGIRGAIPAGAGASVEQLDGKAGAGVAQPRRVQAYVCGPPGMTDALVEQLHALGLEEGQVHSERWW